MEDLDLEKSKKRVIKQNNLLHFYSEKPETVEIGIDEVGRGPLFGRLYSAAVILPKNDSFDHSKMKDSKKFHSKKKIEEIAEYIKKNAIGWSINWEDERIIDEINILQATQKCMHKCIHDILKKIENPENIHLLIDGNYFKSYTYFNANKKQICELNYDCIEGGDNKYSCIAAASILAKVERDKYIEELCKENPDLIEKYSIDSNKGYGTAKHLEGIKTFGITQWHRKSFGICKSF
jgi:ribonuclease HII